MRDIKKMTDNLMVLKRLRENEKGLRIYYKQYFLVIETRKYDEVIKFNISKREDYKVLLGNELEQEYLEGIIGIKLDAYPCDRFEVRPFAEGK